MPITRSCQFSYEQGELVARYVRYFGADGLLDTTGPITVDIEANPDPEALFALRDALRDAARLRHGLELLAWGTKVCSCNVYDDEKHYRCPSRLARALALPAENCSICRGYHGLETIHACE